MELSVGDTRRVVYATVPTDRDTVHESVGVPRDPLGFATMRMRGLGAVVAAAALLTVGCTSVVDGSAVAGEKPGPAVSLSSDGFGVELGTSDTAKAEVYIELQCPHCAEFFTENAEDVTDAIDRGDLSFTIRPVTFLDDEYTDYSARASNAVFLVAEQEGATPTLVMEFVSALYDELLTADTAPTDDELAQIANDVGVEADTVNRIAAAEPTLDTLEMSDANLDAMDRIGADGTPTVYDLVAETDVDINDANWLKRLVG